MDGQSENENWLRDIAGAVFDKRILQGKEAVSSAEALVYWVFVGDDSMRNVGDLSMAFEVYPDFQTQTASLATMLSLERTSELFQMSRSRFEQVYLKWFDEICAELHSVEW